MKRVFILAAAAGLLTAGASMAADHSQMHEMMQKKGGPKPETRTELKLPPAMKVMQKGMMRQHMNTVSEITAALAANDLKKAAKVSKDNLGWSADEEQRCKMVGEITGEPDFVSLGMAVHKSADELSANADAGNRDKALENLAVLIKNCNACHDRFRH